LDVFEQQEMLKQFGSLDLITKNFITLKIVFSQQKAYIISDKPAMSSDDLISSLGGLFSLWLGMTAIFVMEICELLYLITRSCLQTKTTMVMVKSQT
jgi:uncharacterized protein VirK/YbjX